MMTTRIQTWLVCAAATWLVACGEDEVAEAPAEAPTAEETAEAAVPEEAPPRVVTAAATRIALVLAADPRVDATHFDVEVVDGVATLTGEPASHTEHVVAEALALADADVSEVVMSATRPPLAEGESAPSTIDAPDPAEAYADLITAGTPADPDALLPVAEGDGEEGPSEEELAAAASGDRPRTYRVQGGDSLSIIARRTMGDGDLWRQLYEHNRNVIGPDPNGLQVGMELRIPQD